MSRPRRVGLAWYSPEHYDGLRRGLADGANLPETYEAWRMSAEQVEREVTRSGVDVVRVPLELVAFTDWCERTQSVGDGGARARYVAERLEGQAGV